MTKAEHFLYLVQTAIVTKYICDPGDGTSPMSRPMWSIENMDDAIKVSGSIPPDITPREAAEAFTRWLFHQTLSGDDETVVQILLGDGI